MSSAQCMSIITAFLIVNIPALILILLSPDNKTPLYTDYTFITWRIIGVPLRDIIVTVALGSIISWLSDTSCILCIFLELGFGLLLHSIFKPKTMISYLQGKCDKPDGTGKLALPILREPFKSST
jgi:hypothetical protein